MRRTKAQLALECERPFNSSISQQHIASPVVLSGMQTFLVILGIWLLINVLFVVIMIPPRKPRKSDQPRSSSTLAPVPIGQNAYAFDEDEKVSLRHTIIAIAMGALFSLTPPLLQAVDDIKRMIGKYRKPLQHAEMEGDGRSLDTALKQLRARETQTPADGSSSGEQDGLKQ
ncbi:phosphonate metabolism protein PhnM [Bradyrhizobium cytisi]|nr:phosphonate metabolism protein PhnM [Bradyrhizobium cytisi]